MILGLASAVFGAGFLVGLRWNCRKHEKMCHAKMRLHDLA